MLGKLLSQRWRAILVGIYTKEKGMDINMKKNFFDEQILDLRNQKEEETKSRALSEGSKENKNDLNTCQIPPEERSIYTGIRVEGTWVYFERRFLREEVISIMLPESLAPMSLEEARIKYPSEHRPQTILTDPSGTVNLLFQQMVGTVTNEGIEDFRNQAFGMMKRINQGIKQMEQGVTEAAGKHIAYVEFSNPTMDGKLYNLMFFLEAEGIPYMGTFNCRTKGMKYWRTAAFEMIKSIQIVQENE